MSVESRGTVAGVSARAGPELERRNGDETGQEHVPAFAVAYERATEGATREAL